MAGPLVRFIPESPPVPNLAEDSLRQDGVRRALVTRLREGVFAASSSTFDVEFSGDGAFTDEISVGYDDESLTDVILDTLRDLLSDPGVVAPEET